MTTYKCRRGPCGYRYDGPDPVPGVPLPICTNCKDDYAEPVNQPEGYVACAFCSTTTTRDMAAATGWVPSYWQNGAEVCRPACPVCMVFHLNYEPEHGDYAAK